MPGHHDPVAAHVPQAHAAPNSDKMYLVKPPVGRFHESLWEIAQNHLGDGRRYREIFELNSGRIQPDGTKLTIASLIRPGWVLLLPGPPPHPPDHGKRTPPAQKASHHRPATHPACPYSS